MIPSFEHRHALGGRACPQVGGSSKSSQDSTTSNTTQTTTTDRRVVADGGSAVIGDGSTATVTMTDFNAINKGAELAQLALVNATKVATDSQTNGSKAVSAALSTSETALGKLEGAYQKANEQAQAVASGNKTLAIVGMIVAGLLGVELLKRSKRAS